MSEPADLLPAIDGRSTRLARTAAPLRQEVVIRLREAILTSVYKPGERLVERALCERFGISRTVVREALRQLETEGLVTIVANRGPIVTVLTESDATELYEVRAALEALAAELFAKRATEADRARLGRAVEEMAASFEHGGTDEWLKSKDEFYEAMFDGARNEMIRGVLVGLHARVQIFRRMSLRTSGRPARSIAEIRDIADAAIRGDARKASAAARRHVEQAARAALAELRVST